MTDTDFSSLHKFFSPVTMDYFVSFCTVNFIYREQSSTLWEPAAYSLGILFVNRLWENWITG